LSKVPDERFPDGPAFRQAFLDAGKHLPADRMDQTVVDADTVKLAPPAYQTVSATRQAGPAETSPVPVRQARAPHRHDDCRPGAARSRSRRCSLPTPGQARTPECRRSRVRALQTLLTVTHRSRLQKGRRPRTATHQERPPPQVEVVRPQETAHQARPRPQLEGRCATRNLASGKLRPRSDRSLMPSRDGAPPQNIGGPSPKERRSTSAPVWRSGRPASQGTASRARITEPVVSGDRVVIPLAAFTGL
jgi:hypothetical protein